MVLMCFFYRTRIVGSAEDETHQYGDAIHDGLRPQEKLLQKLLDRRFYDLFISFAARMRNEIFNMSHELMGCMYVGRAASCTASHIRLDCMNRRAEHDKG
jgi:hypothetical protein